MQLGSLKTWLGGIAGVLLVPVMFVAAHRLTPGAPLVIRPAAHFQQAELQATVDEANRTADASYEQVAAASRTFLRALRSAPRLESFVGELLSLQQKLQLSSDWWNNTGSGARLGALFAEHVADEQFVSDELEETARAYQNLLAAQDYALLTSVGVDAEIAKQAIAKLDVAIPTWHGMFGGAIHTSLAEAQKDVARGVGSIAASNVIGNGIHDGARSAGFQEFEEGSWSDVLTRVVIEAGVSAIIDHALDPTEEIVADLGRQLERAEADVLEGPEGFLPLLRKMNESHRAARREWILSTTY